MLRVIADDPGGEGRCISPGPEEPGGGREVGRLPLQQFSDRTDDSPEDARGQGGEGGRPPGRGSLRDVDLGQLRREEVERPCGKAEAGSDRPPLPGPIGRDPVDRDRRAARDDQTRAATGMECDGRHHRAGAIRTGGLGAFQGVPQRHVGRRAIPAHVADSTLSKEGVEPIGRGRVDRRDGPCRGLDTRGVPEFPGLRPCRGIVGGEGHRGVEIVPKVPDDPT